MYFMLASAMIIASVLYKKKRKNLPFETLIDLVSDRTFIPIMCIVCMIMCIIHIHAGHDWGGDFSCYIAQALSIMNGSMQEQADVNSYMMSRSHYLHGPGTYPWGYPLVLAPVISLFGINYYVIKELNAVIYCIIIIVLYYATKRFLNRYFSRLFMVFMALNPALLDFMDYIYADMLFCLFSIMSVYAIIVMYYDAGRELIKGFAVGFLCFLAFFTKTNGIVSILTLVTMDIIYLIFVYIIHKKDILGGYGIKDQKIAPHILAYATFTILMLFDRMIFPRGSVGYGGYLRQIGLYTFKENFTYLAKRLPDFWGIGGVFSIIMTVVMMISCMYVCVRENGKNAASIVYCLGMTVLIMLFPINSQGIRYLYPVLPWLIMAMYRTLEHLSENGDRVLSYAGIAPATIALMCVIVSGRYAVEEYRYPEKHYSNYSQNEYALKMYDYIRNNTDEDDIIISPKPRVIWLCTGRKGYSLGESNADTVSDADYALAFNGMDGEWYNEYIKGYKVEIAYTNEELTLYRIKSGLL